MTDIRGTLALAFPGRDPEMVEHLAVEAFLTALDNGRQQLRIREREPKTLDEAFKVAVPLEAHEKAASEPELTNKQRVNRSHV